MYHCIFHERIVSEIVFSFGICKRFELVDKVLDLLQVINSVSYFGEVVSLQDGKFLFT